MDIPKKSFNYLESIHFNMLYSISLVGVQRLTYNR